MSGRRLDNRSKARKKLQVAVKLQTKQPRAAAFIPS